MPASSILANISSDSVFGPMVQTILVFFMTVLVFKLRRMGETCFLGALPESESGITKVVVPCSKDR
ncbi:Uncharacterised protein [Shigella sonnei]|nr:Uncharacterised protein [Shigella sonnei]CSR55958.1 Uncharacterised protein [Shigella sonnei]CST38608.1 Uncharacterised protein [Shigella sonnei]